MFEGFDLDRLNVGEAEIMVRRGGSGPPLLLLHGNPQTHAMWHAVAPILAQHFSVVATDLRGYGDSSKPPTDARHAPYSKRTLAADQLKVMQRLGYEGFFVAGHDRGGRVAYRMALDAPTAVRKLAVLDIIPMGEAFARMDHKVALGYWQWLFMAQPYDLPEHFIGLDPEGFLRRLLARGPQALTFFTPAALDEYIRCFSNPDTLHAICEELRAGATIDCEHDWADQRDGRKIACPVLVLWGSRGRLSEWYDVLAVWRSWAEHVSGRSLATGHYLAEEAPSETAQELISVFTAGAAG
jgi:haloacetate dehalogenase